MLGSAAKLVIYSNVSDIIQYIEKQQPALNGDVLPFYNVPYRKKICRQKMKNFSPVTGFFADYFLPTINFYRLIFLLTFSIFLLRNTLSLSIRLEIRLKFLKLNKIMSDQGKRLMFF